MKQPAVCDTDFLIHVLRGNALDLVKAFFDPISIDKFNAEIEFNNYVKKNGIPISFPEQSVHVVEKDELRDKGVLSIYDQYIQECEKLFAFKDKGEQQAIALALALGREVLLTDDYKDAGPYRSINRGMFELVALSSTDLLALHVLSGNLSIIEAHERFVQMAVAYDIPPSFRSRMLSFVRNIVKNSYSSFVCSWFEEWKKRHCVTEQDIRYFAKEVKNMPIEW